jgi:alpha-amylase/alpha-mannosidase (GH57 family)
MSTPLRYICIHGHFYQPPRENPWLEEIEIQPSAHPFHDWNERIARECYAPNAQARLLDHQGRLRDISNNYQFISFDFGPTLLSWLEKHAEDTYQAILDADAASRRGRSGHGNAIAQAYNHLIMPLASAHDKHTQVVWGMEDFRKRFQRDPEGMWLPETAADKETLEVLAKNGIRFTILAPHQARRFRNSSKDGWTDLNPGSIDPSRPYMCHLSGGRSMALFFYDAPISHSIAFEQLLNSGENLKNRLLGGFADNRSWPQVVHIATDGESYGHHHRFGEMALAYALDRLAEEPGVRLTNYGEFLDKHPPSAEVSIQENSSWSCVHGVGRWKEDCSCSVSQRPDWNQKWRKPLRTAMDLLRDRVDKLFVEQGGALLKDPWEARNAYIRVILDRQFPVDSFLDEHTTPGLMQDERKLVLQLLEMQRNRMLMYTSCGWFFDDLSGIESLQILSYAARALQLAHSFDPALIGDFLHELSAAQTNARPLMKGDELFREKVMPQVTGLARVAAHVAVSSLFREAPRSGSLYCYDRQLLDLSREESGERVLLLGTASVSDRMLLKSRLFTFAVIHLGGVDLRCSVGPMLEDEARVAMNNDLVETFRRQSSTELVRKLDRYFPRRYFSVRDLFVDQRRKIMDVISEKMFQEQIRQFEAFFARNKDLARIIVDHRGETPEVFVACARFVLKRTLNAEIEKIAQGAFPDRLESVLRESRFWNIKPELGPARQLIGDRIVALLRGLGRAPHGENAAAEIVKFLGLAANLDIQVQLTDAQVLLLRILRSMKEKPRRKIPQIFCELADRLAVTIPSGRTGEITPRTPNE